MAQANANLIWKIAELLRGPYKPNQYGDVILPFMILRRLGSILEPTKDEVLAEYQKIQSTKVDPGVLRSSALRSRSVRLLRRGCSGPRSCRRDRRWSEGSEIRRRQDWRPCRLRPPHPNRL